MIGHVTLGTSDLELAMTFYTDLCADQGATVSVSTSSKDEAQELYDRPMSHGATDEGA